MAGPEGIVTLSEDEAAAACAEADALLDQARRGGLALVVSAYPVSWALGPHGSATIDLAALRDRLAAGGRDFTASLDGSDPRADLALWAVCDATENWGRHDAATARAVAAVLSRIPAYRAAGYGTSLVGPSY